MDAASLREAAGKRRDALSAAERADKSELIWKRLAELPEFQRAGQALFYASFKSEVETGLMRSLARERGMAVAVPRGSREDRLMTFHYIDSDSDMESGPYGILQPPADPKTVVDLGVPSIVIVPGLVFDLSCNRLGWGAGFYDRFLASEGRGLPSVGLAFDCQVVERIPAEPHDVPVGHLITESRLISRP